MTSGNAALWAVCLGLGVLPVIAFLLALVALDSYRLIRLRWVLSLIALGGLVALACAKLNPALLTAAGLDPSVYSRYVGPVVEEILKAAFLAIAVWRRRIGFLVDAAIWGFAIGAGFAMVENIHFFVVLESLNPALWALRGFGTAIMHGGATSIFAMGAIHLTDRFDSRSPHLFLPGLLLAIAVHSFFNHFLISPSLSTLALLSGLSLLFVTAFRVSEEATHRWLGTGFDSDQELLELIKGGDISSSRVGRYLLALRRRFPPLLVADMLNLIRLHLELSIRAKGVMLMQKAGFAVPPDPEVDARFQELRYLEQSVGKTGLLALQPVFSMSSRDLWQFHMYGRR